RAVLAGLAVGAHLLAVVAIAARARGHVVDAQAALIGRAVAVVVVALDARVLGGGRNAASAPGSLCRARLGAGGAFSEEAALGAGARLPLDAAAAFVGNAVAVGVVSGSARVFGGGGDTAGAPFAVFALLDAFRASAEGSGLRTRAGFVADAGAAFVRDAVAVVVVVWLAGVFGGGGDAAGAPLAVGPAGLRAAGARAQQAAVGARAHLAL